MKPPIRLTLMPKHKLKLNDDQKKFLPAIRWLLMDNETPDSRGYRCTGRSTLMAYVFLEMALSQPKRVISLFDHVHGSLSTNGELRRYMAKRVASLADTLELKGIEVDQTRCTVRYVPEDQ